MVKNKSQKYAELAQMAKNSFEDKFYNGRRKCLYDVLGDSKIRPNQLFALSLTYPIIDPNSEMAQNIIKIVEKKIIKLIWTTIFSKRRTRLCASI